MCGTKYTIGLILTLVRRSGLKTRTVMNRILTGIMAIMVLFVVLFSAFFIVSHADHDCSGEDCPVCACIQQCENILHGADGNLVFANAGFMPLVLVIGSILVSYCVVISGTPVSAKVRMNN